ncbi:MAG: phage tail protein [Symploca sp. SIO1A3]|nr:phage tail protein [Symploca sp. SIO1A3]
MVSFLGGGLIRSPYDVRFQKVSGLSATIETREIREGGENIFMQRLPNRVTYENLVLERGMVVKSFSPLAIGFNLAMSTLKLIPSNVLVMLLDENDNPIVPDGSWLLQQAYPVKWSVSDLDATQNEVMIETMELAYSRIQSLSY